MSDGGKRFTASMPAGGDATKPGWRSDPDRPGIQRYWTGATWDDSIAPRPKPEMSWRWPGMIAVGVLIAAVAIFAVMRLTAGPSDEECLAQRHEQIADTLAAERAIGGGTDRSIDYVSAECIGRGF